MERRGMEGRREGGVRGREFMLNILSFPIYSPEASRCCTTDCQYSAQGTLCLRGDLETGGCQNASYCKYPYTQHSTTSLTLYIQMHVEVHVHTYVTYVLWRTYSLTLITGSSATCPPGETLPDRDPCNFGNNVCDHGVCNGMCSITLWK